MTGFFKVYDTKLKKVVVEYSDYNSALIFCLKNEPPDSEVGKWRYIITPERQHVAGGE